MSKIGQADKMEDRFGLTSIGGWETKREKEGRYGNHNYSTEQTTNRRLKPKGGGGQFRPLEFEARCKKMEKRSDGRKGIDGA